MSSVIQVGTKWRAQVRRKNFKPQTKTFESKKEAEAWARSLEVAIDKGGKPSDAGSVRLAYVIKEYRQLRRDGGREIDPTSNTAYMLSHLEDDLGHERIVDLTPDRMVRWARMRKDQGAGPYTVNMELSCLGTTMAYAASLLGLQLPDVAGQARPLLMHLQLIGAGIRRTRRPTENELASVLAWVQERDAVAADAMRVAAVTGLRRSELVMKLRWDRLDVERKAALIVQRKNPRQDRARDEWVPMLGDTWDIVQRQPKVNERVFPVSPEKISDLFTAATRALSIPDLRLHDLRHLASSKLQELGFDDVERMTILGHKSVAMNARYTHSTPEHLHAKFTAATAPPAPPAGRRKPRSAGSQ
jgi:integrase